MAAVLEVVPRVYEGGIGVNGEQPDSVVIGSSMCTSSSDMTTEPGDGVFSRHTVHKDGVIFRQKPIVGKHLVPLFSFSYLFSHCYLFFLLFLTLSERNSFANSPNTPGCSGVFLLYDFSG